MGRRQRKGTVESVIYSFKCSEPNHLRGKRRDTFEGFPGTGRVNEVYGRYMEESLQMNPGSSKKIGV